MEKRRHQYRRVWRLPASTLMALFCLFLTSNSGYAQMAKLTWDPNPETYVTGYNVYRSQQSGVFASGPLNGSMPVTTTAFTDATVQSGNTYYYVVRARTVDGIESPNSTQIQAAIPAANKGPGVNAGADQTITLPSGANLTATAIDDGLPNGVLTYQWSVVSGGGVTFSNARSPTTSASMTAAGTYTLRVSVSDGQFSATDDVVVTVKTPVTNQAPLVTTGPNQTITLPGQATLTAQATDDGLPAGTLRYNWTVASGSGVTFGSPTSPTTTASFTGAGKYVLRVTVTDTELSATRDVTVDVINNTDLTLFVSKGREVLRGAVTSITGSYEDPRVENLELYINQAKVLSVPSRSFNYRWDLRHLSGQYTIQARAYSSSNLLLSEKAITVTVK